LLAAASGYRRGTNFRVSSTSTWYGDLQFFSWTHWSFHHCALGEEPAIAGDAPYAFIITAFPMTSYLLWRAHREPVDSRSPRLNGPGPSDSITWSLPKDSVSGGRMEQAPCLPHGLFFWPCCCCRCCSCAAAFSDSSNALRNSSTASTCGDFKPSFAIYLHPARYPKGTAILLLETP